MLLENWVDLENYHRKKNNFASIYGDRLTGLTCGGHFAVCTNTESLSCTPEANIMLWELYLN